MIDQIFGLIIAAALADESSRKAVDLNPHFSHSGSPDITAATETVETHESIVELGGVKFKQIEYNGEHYFIDTRQPDTHVDCGMTDLQRESFAAQGGVKINQRTKLFLETLRQRCVGDTQGSIVTAPTRDMNLGIQTGGPGPEDQQKKIYVNPVKKSAGVGVTF